MHSYGFCKVYHEKQRKDCRNSNDNFRKQTHLYLCTIWSTPSIVTILTYFSNHSLELWMSSGLRRRRCHICSSSLPSSTLYSIHMISWMQQLHIAAYGRITVFDISVSREGKVFVFHKALSLEPQLPTLRCKGLRLSLPNTR